MTVAATPRRYAHYASTTNSMCVLNVSLDTNILHRNGIVPVLQHKKKCAQPKVHWHIFLYITTKKVLSIYNKFH
jgi:hypothetical protein